MSDNIEFEQWWEKQTITNKLFPDDMVIGIRNLTKGAWVKSGEISNKQFKGVLQPIKKLVKLQAEYIAFLGKGYDKFYNIAHVHGHRCSQEEIDTGSKLRMAIKEADEVIKRSERVEGKG